MMRIINIILAFFIFPIVGFSQYNGGSNEGSSEAELGIQRLDGILTQLPYNGGSGDGHSGQSFQTFLNLNSVSALFSGGSGDGFAFKQKTLFLNNSNYDQFFAGGQGDGADFEGALVSLDGTNINLLFGGGMGDGADFNLASQALSTPLNLYAGGSGDGHSDKYVQSFMGQPLAAMFNGGTGDGHDAFKSDLLQFPSTLCTSSSTLFVNQFALGSKAGHTWQNAMTSLPLAFENAKHCPVDQIWVSQGTYMPTSNLDRTIALLPPSNVAVYGGFLGNEINLAQRDWDANVTILSGDIGVISNISDNSYHIIDFSNTQGNAILDGFFIEKGNANSGTQNRDVGAAFYNKAESISQILGINNVLIRDCRSIGIGCGLYTTNANANITMFNTRFSNNIGLNQIIIYLGNGNLTAENVILE